MASCTSCSRRDFVGQLSLAAIGGILFTACGDGEVGGPTGPGIVTPPPPPGGTALVVNVADFPALASVGGIARVDGDSSSPIAVARTAASTFVAVSMICPHAGFRPINIRTGGFRCPNHGAEFTTDGTWSGGQPTTSLSRYTVEYDAGAGTLTIS